MAYAILLIESEAAGLPAAVCDRFDCKRVGIADAQAASVAGARAAVLDMTAGELDLPLCERVLAWRSLMGLPLVAVAQNFSLRDKLRAFEYGLDDVIDGAAPAAEIEARIAKSIFNHIASEQLSQRLTLTMNPRATADPSRLHEFWKAALTATGPDELGQLMFRELADSDWLCSLQLRSGGNIKNMEAHGMAKDLESQLLTQLSGAGPELQFGRRAVINRGRASALIKNLPVEPGAAQAAKNRLGQLLEVLDHCLGARCEATALREQLGRLNRLMAVLNSRAPSPAGATVIALREGAEIIPFKDGRER